jgi:mRNA interferase RelE/StbE
VPAIDVRRILDRIEALHDDPRRPGSRKLGGSELYRIRQGSHRIVYSIDDDRIVIEVIRFGHRRDEHRS